VPKGFWRTIRGRPAAFQQFVLYVNCHPPVATLPTLYQEIVDRFRAMVPFLRS